MSLIVIVLMLCDHPVIAGVLTIVAFLVLDLVYGEDDPGDGGPHGWTYDPRDYTP